VYKLLILFFAFPPLHAESTAVVVIVLFLSFSAADLLIIQA